MPQDLYLGNNLWVTIDRAYKDGGEPPHSAVIGGQIVRMSEGRRPLPTIFMKGAQFFYEDMKPVTEEAHVGHLPTEAVIAGKRVNPRQMAVDFIRARIPKKPLKPQRREGPPPPPKAAGAPVEIKDEQTLADATGGVLIH
jgi:hypothetical protein